MKTPLWPDAPIDVEWLSAPLQSLAPDEVFVFGSNATGFHGAGAAGLACRGDAANTWRRDPWFQLAMNAAAGAQERVGQWAIFGVSRGYQAGVRGRSYAIETIARPGARRSTSLREIYSQLVELVTFARSRPGDTFLITDLGEGYAGYTREEMGVVWRELHARVGIPPSFRFIRLRPNAGPAAGN